MLDDQKRSDAQKRNAVVLDRIKKMSDGDIQDAEVINQDLDVFLDMLYENDFFGTEGQLDPRGDQRDKPWSMDCVQGVDE